jgi:DNA-binding NarL/FixJ family response regulator
MVIDKLSQETIDFIIANRNKMTIKELSEKSSVSFSNLRRAIGELIARGDLKDARNKNEYYEIEGEIWRKLKLDEVVADTYLVSNLGRVYNSKLKTLMIDIDENKNHRNYHLVMLNKKDNSRGTYKVHRLVAITFIKVPDILKCFTIDKLIVNHKNGKKRDNCVNNLEWMTMKENIEHAITTGLVDNKAWNNFSVKRTPEQIILICTKIKEGLSNKEIAKLVNLDPRRINAIRVKEKWKSVSDLYF